MMHGFWIGGAANLFAKYESQKIDTELIGANFGGGVADTIRFSGSNPVIVPLDNSLTILAFTNMFISYANDFPAGGSVITTQRNIIQIELDFFNPRLENF